MKRNILLIFAALTFCLIALSASFGMERSTSARLIQVKHRAHAHRAHSHGHHHRNRRRGRA